MSGPAPLAAGAVAACARRGLTLATAESLTGGALASAVVEVPGASRVLRGGVVAYATALKSQLLGVDEELLSARGAVDAEVAAQMCAGARARLGASLGLATTGVAGPDPQDGRAPGTVFVAVSADWLAGGVRVRECTFDGDRAQVRAAAVAEALDLLVEAVALAPEEQGPARGS